MLDEPYPEDNRTSFINTIKKMFRRKKRNSFAKRYTRFYFIITFLLIIVFVNYIHVHLTTVPEEEEIEQFLNCTQLCPYVGNFTRNHLVFDSTHFIQHHPEFICPSNFRNLADWIYGCSKRTFNQRVEITTKKGQYIAPCLPNGSIIYVSRSSLDKFFTKIYSHLINNFVLITGEGDESSPNNLTYLEDPDSKIIHWFGQNGQIDASTSDKFTHIPLGINCHEMAKAIQDIYANESNKTLPSIHGDIDEPFHYIQPLDLTRRALDINANKLLLINFDRYTDWTLTRRLIWKTMCQSTPIIPFVTCFDKFEGVEISQLSKIYARNRQYAFWLSPRGNGLDCHRTWEALYLDVIPIVWNTTLNILYENLPVIIIDNHFNITETFLRQKLREISILKYHQMTTVYQFEKLRNAYWRRLILSKSRHSIKDNNIRTELCWRASTF